MGRNREMDVRGDANRSRSMCKAALRFQNVLNIYVPRCTRSGWLTERVGGHALPGPPEISRSILKLGEVNCTTN